MTVEEYIEAKYSAGGPGSERFEPDATEVHASQVSDCQRKRAWKHRRGHRADPSVYFELGRVFETLYGAALAFEHDPGIGVNDLKRHPPWDIVEMAERVQQDVGVTIAYGTHEITGESDWVVFEEDAPVAEEFRVTEDGTRQSRVDGEWGTCSETGVAKVVETKTTKDLGYVSSPKTKHEYQVYPYMFAMDAPGEVAYMQRNDFEEKVFELELDDAVWTDVVVRAARHAHNMQGAGEDPPPTTPLDESECRWCPFRSECQRTGGSAWQ